MSKDTKEFFECQQCGYCCQGETTVSLDENDKKRMAAFLKMEYAEVEKRYLRVTGNRVQMKTVDGHCIFYKEGTGCTIHQGKPWRCSQWPLHPSILDHESNLEAIGNSCPGINKGLEYDKFCRMLSDYMNDLDS